jgi:ADP-ribosylglycohydrolase
MLDTTTITELDRYRGCLLGGAVGDALGAAVEFDDIGTIRRRFWTHRDPRSG